jgi:hypothetical protein
MLVGNYHRDDQIKEDVAGGTYNTNCGKRNVYKIFVRKHEGRRLADDRGHWHVFLKRKLFDYLRNCWLLKETFS